jgi:SAM-dependent methyltransferase
MKFNNLSTMFIININKTNSIINFKRFLSTTTNNKKIMSSTDPFANQALQYSLARPIYPPTLVNRIVQLCAGINATSSSSTIHGNISKLKALDVGCGSGQLTNLLGKAGFGQVIGIDPSEPQLKHAKSEFPNVSFRVGDANNMNDIKDNSVDLVTVAQALHWFDFHRFLSEARRILKPGGILAIAGYKIPQLIDEPVAQESFDHYYLNVLHSHKGLEKTLWDIDRRRVDSAYKGELFEKYFTHCATAWYPDLRTVTVKDFITFLESQSAYQKVKHLNPNPISPIKDALGSDLTRKIKCEFPFFLVTGSKSESISKL